MSKWCAIIFLPVSSKLMADKMGGRSGSHASFSPKQRIQWGRMRILNSEYSIGCFLEDNCIIISLLL